MIILRLKSAINPKSLLYNSKFLTILMYFILNQNYNLIPKEAIKMLHLISSKYNIVLNYCKIKHKEKESNIKPNFNKPKSKKPQYKILKRNFKRK